MNNNNNNNNNTTSWPAHIYKGSKIILESLKVPHRYSVAFVLNVNKDKQEAIVLWTNTTYIVTDLNQIKPWNSLPDMSVVENSVDKETTRELLMSWKLTPAHNKPCIACRFHTSIVEEHDICLPCASRVDLTNPEIKDLTKEELGAAIRVKLGIGGYNSPSLIDDYAETIETTIAVSNLNLDNATSKLTMKQQQAILDAHKKVLTEFEKQIKKWNKPRFVKGSTHQDIQLAEECKTGCSIVQSSKVLKCSKCKAKPSSDDNDDDYKSWRCPTELTKCAKKLLMNYIGNHSLPFYYTYCSTGPQERSEIKADIVQDVTIFMLLTQQKNVINNNNNNNKLS